MNSFSNRNYYRDFELQRDAALREAHRQHLATLATDSSSEAQPQTTKLTAHLPHFRLPHLRLNVRHALTLVLVIGVLVASTLPLRAQDLTDAGVSEPYHPALVTYRVGYYYQLQGDQERAIELFTEVITSLPNWDGGYSARGDSYVALGYFDRAVADYTEALDLTPGFVSVLYMRGRAYQALGAEAQAIADYQLAAEQMPDYPLSYWGMGDVYFEQGNTATALEYYRQYMALTVETVDAQVTARVTLLEATITAGSL